MRIAMVTIWVEKPQVLSKWYQDVLDMHVVQETPRFVQLGWSEDDALLAFHVGEPIGNPQGLQFHIRVDDVDETFRQLLSKGVTFDGEPSDKPWRLRSASFSDPAGHSLEIETPL